MKRMMIVRKTTTSNSRLGNENVQIGIKMIHNGVVEDFIKDDYGACDGSEVGMMTSVDQLLLL